MHRTLALLTPQLSSGGRHGVWPQVASAVTCVSEQGFGSQPGCLSGPVGHSACTLACPEGCPTANAVPAHVVCACLLAWYGAWRLAVVFSLGLVGGQAEDQITMGVALILSAPPPSSKGFKPGQGH